MKFYHCKSIKKTKISLHSNSLIKQSHDETVNELMSTYFSSWLYHLNNLAKLEQLVLRKVSYRITFIRRVLVNPSEIKPGLSEEATHTCDELNALR